METLILWFLVGVLLISARRLALDKMTKWMFPLGLCTGLAVANAIAFDSHPFAILLGPVLALTVLFVGSVFFPASKKPEQESCPVCGGRDKVEVILTKQGKDKVFKPSGIETTCKDCGRTLSG